MNSFFKSIALLATAIKAQGCSGASFQDHPDFKQIVWVPLDTDYSELGCYWDSYYRAMTYTGIFEQPDVLTCRQQCSARNNRYWATQYQVQCMCTNDLTQSEANYALWGTPSDCSDFGGSWINNIREDAPLYTWNWLKPTIIGGDETCQLSLYYLQYAYVDDVYVNYFSEWLVNDAVQVSRSTPRKIELKIILFATGYTINYVQNVFFYVGDTCTDQRYLNLKDWGAELEDTPYFSSKEEIDGINHLDFWVFASNFTQPERAKGSGSFTLPFPEIDATCQTTVELTVIGAQPIPEGWEYDISGSEAVFTINIDDHQAPSQAVLNWFTIKITLSETSSITSPRIRITKDPCVEEVLTNTITEVQNYEFILGDINPIHVVELTELVTSSRLCSSFTYELFKGEALVTEADNSIIQLTGSELTIKGLTGMDEPTEYTVTITTAGGESESIVYNITVYPCKTTTIVYPNLEDLPQFQNRDGFQNFLYDDDGLVTAVKLSFPQTNIVPSDWDNKEMLGGVENFPEFSTQSTLCPLTYEVLDDEGEVVEGVTIFNTEGSTELSFAGLVFDHQSPITYSLTIRASNSEGVAGLSPKFIFELNPCGNEIVSLNTENIQEVYLSIEGEVTPHAIDFSEYFASNRTGCLTTNYHLTINRANDELNEEQSILYSINSETNELVVNPVAESFGQVRLHASTESGQTNYIEFRIGMYSCTSEDLVIGPSFQSQSFIESQIGFQNTTIDDETNEKTHFFEIKETTPNFYEEALADGNTEFNMNSLNLTGQDSQWILPLIPSAAEQPNYGSMECDLEGQWLTNQHGLWQCCNNLWTSRELYCARPSLPILCPQTFTYVKDKESGEISELTTQQAEEAYIVTTIAFDIQEPQTVQFYIKGTNADGLSGYSSKFIYTLFPCGNEVVSLNTSDNQEVYASIDGEAEPVKVDFSTFFKTNRSGCPITTYHLTINGGNELSEEQLAVISINSETNELVVNPLSETFSYVTLHASTASGKTTSMEFRIGTYSCASEDIVIGPSENSVEIVAGQWGYQNSTLNEENSVTEHYFEINETTPGFYESVLAGGHSAFNLITPNLTGQDNLRLFPQLTICTGYDCDFNGQICSHSSGDFLCCGNQWKRMPYSCDDLNLQNVCPQTISYFKDNESTEVSDKTTQVANTANIITSIAFDMQVPQLLEFYIKGTTDQGVFGFSPKFIYNLFPCGNEVVNRTQEVIDVEIYMDVPQPEAWTLDYSSLMMSNRTGCPVTTYELNMTDDLNQLSEEEMAAFVTLEEDNILAIAPSSKGVHSFRLFAITDKLNQQWIKYSVTVYPCRPAVAQIQPPESYEDVAYFAGLESDVVSILIPADGSIDPDHLEAGSFEIVIPMFSNNDDDALCPLSYSFDSFTGPTEISAPEVVEEQVQVTIPLEEDVPRVFEFKINATNQENAMNSTAKFVVSLFPCGNEIISIQGNASYAIDLDMDNPAPEPTIVNLDQLFESNRTSCQVVNYTIQTTNSTPSEGISPSEEQLSVFSILENTLTLNPSIPGVYQFYVVGQSQEGQYAVIEYNLTVYPCKPSIATISANSFETTRYFSSETEEMVFINITEANVELDDKTEEEFDMVILPFNNNNDTLCPLSYRLSSSNEEFQEYSDLEAPVVDGSLTIKVPVTHGEPDSYEFYLQGYNKDMANVFTPKIVVTLHACGNEIVSSTLTEVQQHALDMDVPTPEPIVIDLNEVFTSNRTMCPVTRWSVKTSNPSDISAATDASEEEASNFWVTESNLMMQPTVPGIYTFFVVGMTEDLQFEYQEYNLTVYPCKASVGFIDAPEYSEAPYFSGYDPTQDIVFINLTETNVQSSDRNANKFTFILPAFPTYNVALCPLNYSLSSSNEESLLYTDLEAPVLAEEQIKVEIPFEDGVPSSFEFYVKAVNKDGATNFTSKIMVTLQPCGNEIVSVIGPLENYLLLDMVKPDPNPTQIDLVTMFSSNRSEHCPISRWQVLTTNQDFNTDITPNETEALNFYLGQEDQSNLYLFPDNPGTFTFFVLAMTEELSHAYQKYSLSVFPCHPSVALLEMADDEELSISKFFDNINRAANQMTYTITEFNADKLQKILGEVELKIPIFKNRYRELCPLSYVLSTSPESVTSPQVPSAPTWTDEYVSITVPLDVTQPSSFEFYLNGYNTYQANLFTPKIKVNIYQCGFEQVTLSTEGELSYELDMQDPSNSLFPNTPQPEEIVLEMTQFFQSNQSYCPITQYAVYLNDDNQALQHPSAAETSNFWITGTKLTMRPTTQGTFTFFVLAKTEFVGFAFQQFNLKVYPCMPSVSVIAPVTGQQFSDSPYFVSFNETANKVIMELNATNVRDSDLEQRRYDLSLPLYQSNGGSLCELTYELLDPDNQVHTVLSAKLESDSVTIQVPFDPESFSTHRFWLRAKTKDNSFAMSPEIVFRVYDCNEEVITTTASERSLELLMLDPAPDATSFNLSEWFESSDSRCPAQRFVISIDEKVMKEPSDAETEVFKVVKDTQLLILPAIPGNFTFWVIGESRSGESAKVKFSLTNFPCDPSVANISPKSGPELEITPFYSQDKDGKVEYLVGMSNVKPGSTSYTVELPLFSNNNDVLCPLTYNLSSSKESYVPYPDEIDKSILSVNNDGLSLSFSLSGAAVNHTFFILAGNQYGAFSSLEVLIENQLICESTKFQAIKPVTYTIERYIEDFPDQTSISIFDAIDEIESSLVGFDFSNPLDCKIGKIKLEASDNVIYNAEQRKLQLLVASDGFRETLLLTYRDTQGYILENTLEISLCGPSFWSLPWCLRPLPVPSEDSAIPDIVINDPPQFTIDISDKVYEIDDLAETYLGFVSATNEEEDVVESETLPLDPLEETEETTEQVEKPEIDPALFLVEYSLSEIKDTEEDEYEVKFEVDPEFADIITFQQDPDTSIYKFSIDLIKFYATGSTTDTEATCKVTLSDQNGKTEYEVTFQFKGLPVQDVEETDGTTTDASDESQSEETLEEEEEPIDESTDEIASIESESSQAKPVDEAPAAFAGIKIPEYVPKKNVPVETIPAPTNIAELKAPTLSDMSINADGIMTLMFSMPMMMPVNWINKYKKDLKTNESPIPEEFIETSSNQPLPTFVFMKEEDGSQFLIPTAGVTFISILDSSVSMKVSFDSIPDPATISLSSGTQADELIVMISKALILNNRDGNSLVLNKNDFEADMGDSFSVSVDLQPIFVPPSDPTEQNVQAVAEGAPGVSVGSSTAATGLSMLSGSPPEGVDGFMEEQQQQAFGSSLKATQPAAANKYNDATEKASSMNIQAIDFYAKANMTWTSKAPSNQALQRMGITTRNTPKQIGSTVVAGAGSTVAGQGAGMAADAVSGLAGVLFEGGEEDIKETVVKQRKRYWASNKLPHKPMINAFVNMIFIKILLSGYTNFENNYLMTSSNFGPNGNLAAGDQFSLIFGWWCFIVAHLILLLVMMDMLFDGWTYRFGRPKAGGLRTWKMKGNHKWLMFCYGIFRRWFYVYMVFFITHPTFAVPQILISIMISPGNVLFGLRLKPLPKVGYLNLTKVQMAIELATLVKLYHMLALADINPPSPKQKLSVGYSILALSQINMVLGKINLYTQQYLVQSKTYKFTLTGIFTKFKLCCCKRKISEREKFFYMSRKELVHSYNWKLKNRYREPKQEIGSWATAIKVAPEHIFRDVPVRPKTKTVYTNRAERRLRERTPDVQAGKIVGKPIDVKEVVLKNSEGLSVISEKLSLDEESILSSKALSFQSIHKNRESVVSSHDDILLNLQLQRKNKSTRLKPKGPSLVLNLKDVVVEEPDLPSSSRQETQMQDKSVVFLPQTTSSMPASTSSVSSSSFVDSSHSYQQKQPQDKRKHTSNIVAVLNHHREMEEEVKMENARTYTAELVKIEPFKDKKVAERPIREGDYVKPQHKIPVYSVQRTGSLEPIGDGAATNGNTLSSRYNH